MSMAHGGDRDTGGQLYNNGRTFMDQAFYRFSLGDVKGALKLGLQSLQSYSAACDLISDESKRKAIGRMEKSLEFCEGLKSGALELSNAQKMLYLGSKIGNGMYYPWNDDPLDAEFDALYSEQPLELSKEQLKGFSAWKRACTLVQQDWVCDPGELTQDLLQDCSVVASLLSIAAYKLRSNVDLLKDSLFPHRQSGGMYHFRIYINGTFRRVIIDDRLPCASTPQSLFVTARQSGVIWPALIEKAYMKVMGGYNFAGSHCSWDTFLLTGWIPQYIPLHHNGSYDNRSSDELWQSIYTGWSNSDLLICVSSGEMPDEEVRQAGIVSNHEYAILALKTNDDGSKQVLVKNPWHSEHVKKSSFALSGEAFCDGAFWVEFRTLHLWFNALSLNWNPKMFPHHDQVHFFWDIEKMLYAQNTKSHWHSPQFVVKNPSKQRAFVNLVLSRHIDNINSFTGFMQLTVYDTCDKIVLPQDSKILIEGSNINTPYTSVKFFLPPGATCLMVPSTESISSDLKLSRFTLDTYSDVQVSVDRASTTTTTWNAVSAKANWISKSSGGPWSSVAYSQNPQFKISLMEPARIRLYALSTSDVAVNISLFYGGGKHIRAYIENEVAASSGAYQSYSCGTRTLQLDSGQYTAIASSFTPEQAEFQIIVVSDKKHTSIEPVTSEQSGKFCRAITKEWGNGNYLTEKFSVADRTTATFHLYSPRADGSSTYQPSIRLSIYENNELKATTDDFADTLIGVYIDNVILLPGASYVATLERMEAGNGSVQLEAFSLSPVNFGHV